MARLVLTHILAAYIGAGLFSGLLMQRAIPAINPLGLAFIAVTWPEQIRCGGTVSECEVPIERVSERAQSWMFSFDTKEG